MENKKEQSKEEKESHIRSVIKGISWRTLGTLDTMLISWLITGSLTFAVSIGGIEIITKIILYYGHERLWQLIPRGTVRNFFSKSNS